MSTLPTNARLRLWAGVALGILLGFLMGRIMESITYGIIIGIVAGVTLGTRWAKAGMKKDNFKFLIALTIFIAIVGCGICQRSDTPKEKHKTKQAEGNKKTQTRNIRIARERLAKLIRTMET